MLVVGLTGSIASGKSTCSHHLSSHTGIAVVDADEIAHDLMIPGGTTYYAILSTFIKNNDSKSLDSILVPAPSDSSKEKEIKDDDKKSCKCPFTICCSGNKDSKCCQSFNKLIHLYNENVNPYIPEQVKTFSLKVGSLLCPHTLFKLLPKECCPSNSRPIDRKALGEIIFNDNTAKSRLNSATHPYIRVVMLRKLLEAFLKRTTICFYDTPLLFEVGLDKYMLNGTVVVYAPKDVQIKRLMARDGLTRDQALLRINSQMDIEDKKAKATFVIDNSKDDLKNTHAQIDDLIGGKIEKSLSPLSVKLLNNHLVYLFLLVPVFFAYLFVYGFELTQALYTRILFFIKLHDFKKFIQYFNPFDNKVIIGDDVSKKSIKKKNNKKNA